MEGRKRSRNGIDAVAQASNAFSIADWRPTQYFCWKWNNSISARDSPLKAPLFDTSTWERKEASSFDDDLAMSVGSATTLSYMMQFRSHSSRQRKVSLMTDQPMELWFGYFCMVLPRTLQIGYFHVWLSFFRISFIIDRVRHTIHLFSLEQIDLEQSPSFTHIWYRGAVPMERIKTIGEGGTSSSERIPISLNQTFPGCSLPFSAMFCYLTTVLWPLKEKKHTWRAHRE